MRATILLFTVLAISLSLGIPFGMMLKDYAASRTDSAVLRPTVKPTESIIEYETSVPVKKTYVPIDSDPPIHCQINANCGGGTIPLKQSECSRTTCCQINGKWIFYRDANKCYADQGSKSQPVNANYSWPTLPPIPTLNPFPTFKPYDTSKVRKEIQDLANPLIPTVYVQPIDGTIHWNNPPEPTSKVPVGYGYSN